jgi:dihydrofolate reductase
MTIISMIAAVDEANGLGNNNQLLCHLPADLQHFKALTIGKPVIMGRKTYESIGRPLPNRLNIILSKHTNIENTSIVIVDSIQKALNLTKDNNEIMIIGGAQVYTYALTIANRIYLTRIHHLFKADVFFPQLDESEWQLVSKIFRIRDEKNLFDLSFCTYESIINPVQN